MNENIIIIDLTIFDHQNKAKLNQIYNENEASLILNNIIAK